MKLMRRTSWFLAVATALSPAVRCAAASSSQNGDKPAASADFTRVLRLVLPQSDAARRAEAGLRGESPAATPPQAGKDGGKR